MRLAKYLAHAGVASRRAAEQLILAGRVSVRGEIVADPARDVDADSDVAVDGRPLPGPERRVVYAVNKPVGVLSTARDTHGRPTVLDLVAEQTLRLYPVGRLDADSSGLILLTNDGELANRLTHPSFQVPKTYRATLAGGPVSAGALEMLRGGVELDDGRTAPAVVRPAPAVVRAAPGARRSESVIELTISEGRNRQVRRMCAAVGHPVAALQRIAFGPLRLGDLEAGAHRQLSAAEIGRLRAL
jgi:23S rRNA pseudouridine2605 synthase